MRLIGARPRWRPASTNNPDKTWVNLPAVHIVQLHFRNDEPNFDRYFAQQLPWIGTLILGLHWCSTTMLGEITEQMKYQKSCQYITKMTAGKKMLRLYQYFIETVKQCKVACKSNKILKWDNFWALQILANIDRHHGKSRREWCELRNRPNDVCY